MFRSLILADFISTSTQRDGRHGIGPHCANLFDKDVKQSKPQDRSTEDQITCRPNESRCELPFTF